MSEEEKKQQEEIIAEENEQNESSEKTFTQDEVNQIVKDRLEREKKRVEEEREKEAAKRAEAEKLAKMNEAEKNEYEINQWKTKAEEAQRKLDAYEMRSQARKMLNEKGINPSDEQLDLVVSSDADATAGNIDRLVSLVQDTKESVRKELLSGSTPSASGKSTTTKEEINKIKDPVARRQAMLENIDLYN